ncbi:PREDICTED: leukotriene A-4 hydrolase homolog isoform X2 [Camelina sativa]|uniref:Leukotriene A-4 hydrolase homolog isoform X1 n=1 Tax=Camelina sativa TaxID=90675 RepID=A0ABM0T2H5_CAMSA|nr:PREDICTED: leukotriene A-4 hydrolase homolog isoform X1 [Camelina sativa]XP_010419937.1 PREDICTED: leukotriene A-4 hydrolase homolog isoform X2 [Camelina sativa]
MAPIDPHSFTDSSHPLTTHVSLSLYLDFNSFIIHGSALLTLSSAFSGELSLDTRSISIDTVLDPLTLASLPYRVSATPDPIRGTQVVVVLSGQSSVLIVYSTSPSASALQWLSPLQTFSKSHHYVYTQCQAIHARSIFPCQDTPAARIRYDVVMNIPNSLSAVMSARHVRRRLPVPEEAKHLEAGSLGSSLWSGEDRVVEEFAMEQPIPPYLFAFAVGELGFREVGPRTRVYTESAAVEVLDAAALEFAGTEDMIKQGEMLFGDYEWERFDLLVLPPSFPYGGMENPRMVFLTPTVIKGDSSGAQVVAHELAHSWTGNLITNINNEHFWLNEGFTTYAERRIVEVVQGADIATLNMGIGWRGLTDEMERFKDNLECTKLWNNQEGVDPDDVYSQVPYEKGFQFVLRIERQIGRTAFDEFLKKYIATFKFKSIDTNTFLEFLKANIPGIEKEINLQLWTEGVGIPEDAYEPVSTIYTKIISLAKEFKEGRMPSEDEVAKWNGQEWELYLENLPKSCEPSQVMALDKRYRLAESKDYEVKVSFLQLAIASKCREYHGEVEKALKAVGRMKYLRPLFTALAQTGGTEEKQLAKQVFAEARETYHPIAQGVVESILSKYI